MWTSLATTKSTINRPQSSSSFSSNKLSWSQAGLARRSLTHTFCAFKAMTNTTITMPSKVTYYSSSSNRGTEACPEWKCCAGKTKISIVWLRLILSHRVGSSIIRASSSRRKGAAGVKSITVMRANMEGPKSMTRLSAYMKTMTRRCSARCTDLRASSAANNFKTRSRASLQRRRRNCTRTNSIKKTRTEPSSSKDPTSSSKTLPMSP